MNNKHEISIMNSGRNDYHHTLQAKLADSKGLNQDQITKKLLGKNGKAGDQSGNYQQDKVMAENDAKLFK